MNEENKEGSAQGYVPIQDLGEIESKDHRGRYWVPMLPEDIQLRVLESVSIDGAASDDTQGKMEAVRREVDKIRKGLKAVDNVLLIHKGRIAGTTDVVLRKDDTTTDFNNELPIAEFPHLIAALDLPLDKQIEVYNVVSSDEYAVEGRDGLLQYVANLAGKKVVGADQTSGEGMVEYWPNSETKLKKAPKFTYENGFIVSPPQEELEK